jgi:Uma2 family endonuclease
MTLTQSPPRTRSRPAWDVATLYPDQGQWDENEYLALTENLNRLVELSQGVLEVLPMPKPSHQRIVRYLFGALMAFVSPRDLGEVLFAPLRIRLWKETYREPDVVFMLAAHADRKGEEYWEGADLVMEVVSGKTKDRTRDLIIKRLEYAKAGINEYWIVDPREKRIIVLKRRGKSYVVHCDAQSGEKANSALLKGFEIDVIEVFSAAKAP